MSLKAFGNAFVFGRTYCIEGNAPYISEGLAWRIPWKWSYERGLCVDYVQDYV